MRCPPRRRQFVKLLVLSGRDGDLVGEGSRTRKQPLSAEQRKRWAQVSLKRWAHIRDINIHGHSPGLSAQLSCVRPSAAEPLARRPPSPAALPTLAAHGPVHIGRQRLAQGPGLKPSKRRRLIGAFVSTRAKIVPAGSLKLAFVFPPTWLDGLCVAIAYPAGKREIRALC